MGAPAPHDHSAHHPGLIAQPELDISSGRVSSRYSSAPRGCSRRIVSGPGFRIPDRGAELVSRSLNQGGASPPRENPSLAGVSTRGMDELVETPGSLRQPLDRWYRLVV